MSNTEVNIQILQKLSTIWARIKEFNPEVPLLGWVESVVPENKIRSCARYFSYSWTALPKDNLLIPKAVVLSDCLHSSAEGVLEQLLHQAAHAINFGHGIKDCSLSQYHNLKFKENALKV